MSRQPWWREAVFYQVYVRSFQDSDGDGVGDLPGIRARLPYLQDLGVDALWLTPFYPSPQADHGYDVADYTGVEPRFGTLGDFDALVAEAHELGMKVTIDIVPNHTSDQHPWFRNAISGPDHPDRARYMFRPGKRGGPPNGWTSAFGGSAWSRDAASGDYYLHFFAPEQPDLDWHNEAVQRDFEQILRFWLDRGVDGFRIDVAHALFKAQDLHEMVEPVPRPHFGDWLSALMQPELHPLYRRWRQIADEYPGDRMFVAEIVIENQEKIASYVASDQLHLSFNFALLHAPWDAEHMRETIERTLEGLGSVGAPATWVFENHDVTRLPTRYGGGDLGRRRARAAALLLFGLPGTSFVYEGQELGLEEVDLPEDVRQDPIFFRTNGERKGRDGCRVPIPWTTEPPAFGFTEGEPWLPMPRHWGSVSSEAQAGEPGSMLALFRSAIRLRPRGQQFSWRDGPESTLSFDRGDVTCAVNFAASELELPSGELLLASEPGIAACLPPNSAAWVRRSD
ncbi:MAG TPA: alpha-amylase family glycosyl hydrolase [Gaiellaceae bacterium]|nr:alpha-amylase family glycosyl hydrolase [Gaiellaceae bacterium]